MSGEVFLDGRVTLHAGDCLTVLDDLPENSVDAVCCDPPYHFNTIVERFGKKGSAPAQSNGATGVYKRASGGFMGKDWDGGDVAFRQETWAKVLRVLKPGGHIAAFSAPKCVHKMAMAMELAGFEMRDRIVHLFDPDPHVAAFLESLSPAQADSLFRLFDHFGPLGEAFWAFGSGFPKSHNVAKAIDRHFGKKGAVNATGAPVKRMIPGADQHKDGWEKTNGRSYQPGDYIPSTAEATDWQGWGTALKPAYEPIVIARKPLAEKSVAAQVLATGTGAIHVDTARIDAPDGKPVFHNGVDRERDRSSYDASGSNRTGETSFEGRYPANLSHDGSTAVLADFPETTSGKLEPHHKKGGKSQLGTFNIRDRTGEVAPVFGDSGSASRFFYSSKADAGDRLGSAHPTVKPVDLMQWLCRMLCPKGGAILDPFAGTGTTAEAAYREGMNAILIEREAESHDDIRRRMALVLAGPDERVRETVKAKAARTGEAADYGPLFGGAGV